MLIRELFDVAGRVALVTGGASGIGRACVEVLMSNGARVWAVDLNEEKLTDLQSRSISGGGSLVTRSCDVSDSAAIRQVIDDLVSAEGRLDIAFLNAGIGGGPGQKSLSGEANPEGQIEQLDPEIWQRHMTGNLRSVFASLKAVVPPMRAAGKGSIIVTTSVAGLKVESFVCTAYSAAKAGAAHLVRNVALELARYGVRVNSIAPGAFQSDIGGGRMSDPEVRSRFARANPMGRMADPSEIMGLALFLASDASSYVTGAQLSIDGGGAHAEQRQTS